MTSLHARIKQARINQGISQANLASQTGVSQPTVAHWETGNHIPRPQALERIGQVLDVDETWLLSGENRLAQATAEYYLSKPIRHIPIYSWPKSGLNIFNTPPAGYLPYPTSRENAFALVDSVDVNLLSHIKIFDPDTDRAADNAVYLWSAGSKLSTSSKTDMPNKAVVHGHLRAEIKNY
jgi:transcriptional regulator with XRE-family HTH domain